MRTGVALGALLVIARASSAADMTAEQAGNAARDDLSKLPELAGRKLEVLSVRANPEGVCPGPRRVDAPLPGYVASLRAGARTYLVLVGERETRICFYMDAGEQPKPSGETVPMPPPGPKLPKPTPTPTIKPAPAVTSVPPATSAGVKERPEVEESRRALAERLGASVNDVRVVSFDEVTWPDASAGCPKPGMSYAQVLTPGYRVVLESAGREFEYHGRKGDPPVWCSTPQPPAEDPR